MYRIAVITDIHGNRHALNAVLEDIKGRGVDHIYCLGDMIGIGPFSNEVLDALMELDHVSMITGNHDEAVLALLKNEPYPESRVNVIPHHEWIANRLEQHCKAQLDILPRVINHTIYGHKLHFTHYPMDQAAYHAPISMDPFDLQGPPSRENFSSLSRLSECSLVCFGHDHGRHHLTCNNQTFFNPGSLGCFNKPYARYGIIDVMPTEITIHQQAVAYKFDEFVSELKQSSMPRKEIILNIYI
ncbi:metallophosphoesterase [Thalassobacillus sp. CUG 92003]|uniref:metallophosphoesterase family protein n=1 Tax=Thalassobacillus sp. CUG 92003 TaxID=2736641 RepID=UPI0015E638F1|nr:metallophosphoesterase family protein [Thalassobacillus sp. CUG 92003]